MSIEKEKKPAELPNNQPAAEGKKDGLNAWNDRLDENLEAEDHNDVLADKKSKDFFEKNEKLKDS